MADDIDIINTPESLGVTPRFVLQHNAISRSIHNLSATAKKLAAMAMSLLPDDLSSRTAAFSFADFCKALGFEEGGESYRIFTAAVDECMKNLISIEIEKVVKGKKKKDWEKLVWFSYAKFDAETGICTMTFSQELTSVLIEMKKVYAKINLHDLGRLQSKYSLRFFEIAKSYESLKGKNGNKEGTWYFERDIPELRLILGVPKDAYPEKKEFIKYAVKNPIDEINQAGLGVSMNPVKVMDGRNLKKVRFDCNETPKTPPVKRGRKKKTDTPLELPSLTLPTEDQRQEKELAHLKERYPDEFARLYTEELEKPSFLPSSHNIRKLAAESAAMYRLKEKYGIVK